MVEQHRYSGRELATRKRRPCSIHTVWAVIDKQVKDWSEIIRGGREPTSAGFKERGKMATSSGSSMGRLDRVRGQHQKPVMGAELMITYLIINHE